ncbi:hypothetical protein ACUNWD_16345 [Sunxiuqinia sp. A32]|uniref:hypothetical protein n=1 Tax=Sunxiuqinia sp. A32 TaxID=3461496 RepID=UPI00404666D7
MKALLKTGILGLLTVVLLSSFSLRESPEDPPRGIKKHLKMVKVENGEKTVIDTVITGDADVMTWFSDQDFDFKIDSTIKTKLKKFDIQIEDTDGKQDVFVFSSDDDDPFSWTEDIDVTTETTLDGDSIVKVIVMKKSDGDLEEKVIRMKHPHPFVKVPHPPIPPRIEFFKQHVDGNVINLNDPGIISFKKKDLSGGREKIEIIRQKPAKLEDVEIIEEMAD